MRILRAMRAGYWYLPSQEPDAFKPGAIAKAVGSTPETVKERIKRLTEAGVIAGYRAIPHLAHLGLEAAAYSFQIPDDDAKWQAKERAAMVDGVVAVFDYVGPTLSVFLCHASPAERDRRLRLLSSQTGDAKPMLAWKAPPRKATREVTALDWRLIQALRHDALRPLEDVAREVGVTYRTAKRRLDPLFTGGVVERSVLIDPGKVPGLLPLELNLRLQDDAPALLNSVLKAFDDKAVLAFPHAGPGGHHLNLWLFATTLADAERQRRDAARLKGVQRARALLRREVVQLDGWIDDLIAARIKA